jgi:hypothetical protein
LQSSRRRVEEVLWVPGLNRLTGSVWELLRGGRAMRQTRLMTSAVSCEVVSSMCLTQSELGSTATTLAPKEEKTLVIVPTLAPMSKTRAPFGRSEE